MKRRVVLASASPRRKELLKRFVSEFEIKPTDSDESMLSAETPEEYVKRMALSKRKNALKGALDNDFIIAADTIVVLNSRVFGKPASDEDASRILKELRNKKHNVITSVACIDIHSGCDFEFSTVSQVLFGDYSDELINKYIASHEHMDKAGAYAIQGKGSLFVKSIIGDYDNIVGLPIAELIRQCEAHGIVLF